MTESQFQSYRNDGYVILPALFDGEEVALLREACLGDPAVAGHVLERDDGEGGRTRLTLWRDAGDGALGLVARCRRVVEAAARCVGEEVYHFHSKIIFKEARVGGAWAWHQDFGYWHHDNVLEPRLVSCFIAIDPATRENGCVQVLAGSQRLGRLDHVRIGDQTGADPARVEAALGRFERVYCEMRPGDALFFHCNLLHRSDQNRSDRGRLALICCYNAASNSPFGESKQPSYSKLDIVDNHALKSAGPRLLGQARAFLTR